jgi:CRP/FNR family transcriptional regulator, putaive post-exponential-phase nitrogen-starvation regulator
MEKINDYEILNKYIEKYGITELFTTDTTSFMELFHFKRNELICRENKKINYLFFLVEGKVKVYTTLSNGRSLLLCFYDGLKMLGDLEFINFQNASSNVQVINDAYCIGIPLEKAREHLFNDAKFLRTICNDLSEKINKNSKNSSINLLYPLENRLASFILAAVESDYNSGEKTPEFSENLTEISELLGTSYRHLLRTLKTLCSKGAIKRKKACFEVIDEKLLKDLAAELSI